MCNIEYDNEDDILKEYDVWFEEKAEDSEELIKIEYEMDFVSSGLAFPNASSTHDVISNGDFILVRYRYAGSRKPQRDFCKLMVGDKKVYRKEDILEMGNQSVNPGFGPNGSDVYSIWKYKGGVNCYHYWSRVVYKKKGFDISSIKRIGISNLDIQLPYVESEVEIRPIDMPNGGRLNLSETINLSETKIKNENMNVIKPIYDIIIDEYDIESGVSYISLVDMPAMEVDFIKLSEDRINFTADVDKKLLYGVFIVANKPIYRKSIDSYIVFRKEEIEKIVKKFNKNLNNRNVNFQHTESMVNGYVMENWLVGETDKIHSYIKDVPEGSWAGSIHIEDDNFWNEYVKRGVVNGFSIELMPTELKPSYEYIHNYLMSLDYNDEDVLYKVKHILNHF